MKKLFALMMTLTLLTPAFAWRPPAHHSYHHCHSHYRARDGWAAAAIGVAAGAVGAAIYEATRPDPPVVVQPAPVVVQQPAPVVVQQPAPVVVQQPAPVVVQQPAPVVVQQPVQVWVEGRYVQQVQPNGTVVQVWQNGHYEMR